MRRMPAPCDFLDHIQLRKAVDQFNAGAYYVCHETLEKLWLCEKGPTRDLYKGILQIAVALFHKNRGNMRGAMRLLESGTTLLTPFLPIHAGLDLRRLHHESVNLLKSLQSGSKYLEHPRIHLAELESMAESSPEVSHHPCQSNSRGGLCEMGRGTQRDQEVEVIRDSCKKLRHSGRMCHSMSVKKQVSTRYNLRWLHLKDGL